MNRNTLANIDDQAFGGSLLDALVELDLNDNSLGQVCERRRRRERGDKGV